MSKQTSASRDVWATIDQEKRRDRRLRKISIAAWTVTFAIVLLFAVLIGIQISQMITAFSAGTLPLIAVIGAATPLIIVLGLLSVLIATLSTVGIFLRLRTASLTEIQLRLAALEEMLSARPDTR